MRSWNGKRRIHRKRFQQDDVPNHALQSDFGFRAAIVSSATTESTWQRNPR